MRLRWNFKEFFKGNHWTRWSWLMCKMTNIDSLQTQKYKKKKQLEKWKIQTVVIESEQTSNIIKEK
jgi:hypothetical protein